MDHDRRAWAGPYALLFQMRQRKAVKAMEVNDE